MLVLLAALSLAAAPAQPPAEEGEFQLKMVTAAMLRTSCEGGDATACHRLGRRYEQGTGGVQASAPEAGAWFRKGCEAGVVVDCGLAGNALGVADDPAAHPVAKKGCDAQDPFACYVLGHLLLVGLGTPADPAAGLERIRKGCDAGIPNACTELGQVYAGAAPGVAPEHAKARPLLETSCKEGNQTSCMWLATLLVTGQGGPADGPRGASLFEASCNAGLAIACENLASVYVQGLGVTADLQRAVPWLVKACDGRQGPSCGQLATMALQGQGGLAMDWGKAIEYLKRSCEYGHPPACQEIDASCRAGLTAVCR